jgi:hypothetical protein
LDLAVQLIFTFAVSDEGAATLLFFVVCGGIIAFVLYSQNQRPENVARRKERAAQAAARPEAEVSAAWDRAQRGLALSCVTQVNGLPCSGLAVPIRGTKDRYRRPICGGQFAGAMHGW